MNESLNFFLKTKRRKTGEAKIMWKECNKKDGGKSAKNKLGRAKRNQNDYLMKRSKRQLDYKGNIMGLVLWKR